MATMGEPLTLARGKFLLISYESWCILLPTYKWYLIILINSDKLYSWNFILLFFYRCQKIYRIIR